MGRLPAARGGAVLRRQEDHAVQSESYRRQYGFNSVVLIPGNVYGEYDNFNEEYSHVIPALIRRFIEAKEKGAPSIACFGSGQADARFRVRRRRRGGDPVVPAELQHAASR